MVYRLFMNYITWASMALSLLFQGERAFPFINLCCLHGGWLDEACILGAKKDMKALQAIKYYVIARPAGFYSWLQSDKVLIDSKIEAPFFITQALAKMWNVLLNTGDPASRVYEHLQNSVPSLTFLGCL